jgi:hypothetical protein
MKKEKNCFVIVILMLICGLNGKAQVGNCQSMKAAKQAALLYPCPENRRSDTFDILKYTINLDITDFTNKIIKGNTVIKFKPKMNAQSQIRFDLLSMNIDSVKKGTTLLTYTYTSPFVKVTLPMPYNITDTVDVTVYYNGVPKTDSTGWGGFYFQGNYAFNLGVGFGAHPHNYGRVWFPCFDNFVEKSLYEFNITTDSTKRAYCNGQLISDVKTGSTRTRNWVMQKEIPTYLASVAVADYTQVNWTHTVTAGTIPITLAARPSDTNAVKTGFVNLKNAITAFENRYGPYVWNRVGYCLVPFSSGAMEHATNIAYPQAAIGTLAYEANLMAHELAHHWWGDLMTCETQEDMWLNEGMASYSELIFTEWMYGKNAYINYLKPQHDGILHFANFKETQYWPVSGVPHAYTYGDHVYRKGASVAHNLRTYMGDTAFFNGLQYVLSQKAYKNMESNEFRMLLEASSGQSLSNFFNNWVFTGGYPHFSIDSVSYASIGGGNYLANVHLKQKLTGTTTLYTGVPIEVAFFDANWSFTPRKFIMSGANQSFTTTVPFNPKMASINFENKIADAISSESKTHKTVASVTYAMGKCIVQVTNKGLDSSFIRVEHNYTKPDPIKFNVKNYKISNQHYWKIDGILTTGFLAKLHLNFDGTNGTSGTYTALDTCLTSVQNDSLIVLYRKNAADDWTLVNGYTKYKFGIKAGKVIIDTMKLGEYVFANKNGGVPTFVKQETKKEHGLKLFPNPATNQVTIQMNQQSLTGNETYQVKNIEGKLVGSGSVSSAEFSLDCSSYAKGTYFVTIYANKKLCAREKLIIQ